MVIGCDECWEAWEPDSTADMPIPDVEVSERDTAWLWTPDGWRLVDVDPRPRIGFLS